jgi:hypothetical protein
MRLRYIGMELTKEQLANSNLNMKSQKFHTLYFEDELWL